MKVTAGHIFLQIINLLGTDNTSTDTHAHAELAFSVGYEKSTPTLFSTKQQERR